MGRLTNTERNEHVVRANPDELFAAYQSGLNQPKLAEQFRISQSRVSAVLRAHPLWTSKRKRRHGITNRPRRKATDDGSMLSDYRDGLPMAELMHKYGISYNIVLRRLRRHPDFVERERLLADDVIPIIDGKRACRFCGDNKPLSDFRPKRSSKPNRFGVEANCRDCERLINSQRNSAIHRVLRRKVVAGYGGCCAECGFANMLALQIDHVHDDGAKERKSGITGMDVLKTIIRENFPDRYQLLCANCNTIKAHESGSYRRTRRHSRDIQSLPKPHGKASRSRVWPIVEEMA